MTLPDDFISQMKEIMQDDYPAFFDSLSQIPPQALRTHPHKHLEISGKKIPWSPHGRILEQKDQYFSQDPLFHGGGYYVQNASSQMFGAVLERVIEDIGTPKTVLDLCAAPGGKTTHILDIVPSSTFVVANEIHPTRFAKLKQNVVRWGYSNIVLTSKEPYWFGQQEGWYNMVVVDAPCSGEGMFRKSSDALHMWSLDTVDENVRRQQQILEHAWRALKPGGILIYATCTYNRKENEEQIQWLEQTYGGKHLEYVFPEEWGVVHSDYGLRCYPHRMTGEGLFLAVVQKQEGPVHEQKCKKAKAKRSHIFQQKGYSTIERDTTLHLLPETVMEQYEEFISLLHPSYVGVEIGCGYVGGIKWSHAGIVSWEVESPFPLIEVHRDQAQQYLMLNAISMEHTQGYVMLTYQGCRLGMGQIKNNVLHSKYPQEWRM